MNAADPGAAPDAAPGADPDEARGAARADMAVWEDAVCGTDRRGTTSRTARRILPAFCSHLLPAILCAVQDFCDLPRRERKEWKENTAGATVLPDWKLKRRKQL